MPALTPSLDPVMLLAAFVLAFAASAVGTRVLVWYLGRRNVLDIPNDRSSHDIPKPRGGGLAVVPVVVLAWVAWMWSTEGSIEAPSIVVLAVAFGLAALSFADDLIGLSARLRLSMQLAAVVAGVAFLPGPGGAFHPFLPLAVDLFATAFLWLWLVNLYNFMDGIDGITGTETASIGIGVIGLAALGLVEPAAAGPAAILVGAALGFLVWNWAPSRIFLGDVGSVPLGYLIGALLIVEASRPDAEIGTRLAVAVLPLYYLTDASLTLLKRMIRRENIFQAHRQHFYQLAIRRGHDHATVCRAIALANAALLATALAVVPSHPVPGVLLASMVVAGLLVWMARGPVSAGAGR